MESKQMEVDAELTSSCVLPPFDWIASDWDGVEPKGAPMCVITLGGAGGVAAEEPEEYECILNGEDEPECVFALDGAEMEDD